MYRILVLETVVDYESTVGIFNSLSLFFGLVPVEILFIKLNQSVLVLTNVRIELEALI
jgi:hypothetical protein